MLDPRATDVMGRRLGAWLINLLLVVIPAVAVLWTGIERIPVSTRDATGTIVTETQAQYDYIREVQSGFHRMWDTEDTLYILPGYLSVILPILVLLLGCLVVFLLLPANTGWNPGHKVFGLRIADENGGNPTVAQLVQRWLMGWVDALPWVIPGLLGFIVAMRNDHHQRLGDRLAKTYVVDARHRVRIYTPDQWSARERMLEADPSADLDAMVDLDSRLQPRPNVANLPDPTPHQPEQPLAQSPFDAPAPADSETPAAAAVGAGGATDTSGAIGTGSAIGTSGAVGTAHDGYPNDPTPQRLPQSDHAVASQPAPIAHQPVHQPRAAQAERLSFPKPQHRSSSTPAPTAHPSPTWDPGQLAEPVDPGHLQPPTLATNTQAPRESAISQQAPAPRPTAPEWDPNWHAWLCYDPNLGSWMRHDPESGRWIAIS